MKSILVLSLLLGLLLGACKHDAKIVPSSPVTAAYLAGRWAEQDTSVQGIDSYSRFYMNIKTDSFLLHINYWDNGMTSDSYDAGHFKLVSDSLSLTGVATDPTYHTTLVPIRVFLDKAFVLYRNANCFVLVYPQPGFNGFIYRRMVKQP